MLNLRLWRLGALLVLLGCAGAAVAVVRPATAFALEGPTWLAGDSVRFVARFGPPATAVDSITIAWRVGDHIRARTWRPPYVSQLTDTVRVSVAPVVGGATLGGAVVVRTWRGGTPSAGIIRPIAVDVPELGPPPDVVGFQLVDSARVY